MFRAASIAVVGLSLAVPTAAQAKVIEKTKVTGNSAFATWDYSQDGVITFVSVNVTNNDVKTKPGGKSKDAFAVVSVLQTDIESGDLLLAGTAEFTATEFTFTIDKQLSTARLQASGIFQTSEFQFPPITVDLTWTATGPEVDHKDKSSFEEDGLKVKMRFQGRHRPAQADNTSAVSPTGVVIGGEQVTPVPSATGELQFNKTGSLIIECGGCGN